MALGNHHHRCPFAAPREEDRDAAGATYRLPDAAAAWEGGLDGTPEHLRSLAFQQGSWC